MAGKTRMWETRLRRGDPPLQIPFTGVLPTIAPLRRPRSPQSPPRGHSSLHRFADLRHERPSCQRLNADDGK